MRTPFLAGAVAAAALAGAAPAAADSIVHIRGKDVWLANPDGSGQYQVTTDGENGLPYTSPTQADDGTIAVARYNSIYLLRQNGSVIREIDPPALRNTYSHTVDGTVAQVAISPDGTKLAYAYISYEGGPTPDAQATTGFVDVNGNPLPGNLYHGFASWVTNTRVLTSGGYLHHVNIHDLGTPDDPNWLNDNEGDLSDPAVSRDGRHLAVIRSAWDPRVSGRATTVQTYDTIGDVLTGTPARTANAICTMGPLDGLASPTWAPDNQGLAWEEPDGVWAMPGAATCTGQPVKVIEGGRTPHWGPAAVNPGPREETRREEPRREEPRREQPQPPRRTPSAPTRPTVAAPRTLRALLASGVRVRQACAAACTVTASISVDRATARALRLRRGAVVGTASKRLSAAGRATLAVKPKKALRARLARRRSVTLSLRVVVRQQGARARSFGARAKLRR